MRKEKVKEIADNADMIVSGYAFRKKADGSISILNLFHPDCAMIISPDGELLATNMDDIEENIVHDICTRNLQFLDV